MDQAATKARTMTLKLSRWLFCAMQAQGQKRVATVPAFKDQDKLKAYKPPSGQSMFQLLHLYLDY